MNNNSNSNTNSGSSKFPMVATITMYSTLAVYAYYLAEATNMADAGNITEQNRLNNRASSVAICGVVTSIVIFAFERGLFGLGHVTDAVRSSMTNFFQSGSSSINAISSNYPPTLVR